MVIHLWTVWRCNGWPMKYRLESPEQKHAILSYCLWGALLVNQGLIVGQWNIQTYYRMQTVGTHLWWMQKELPNMSRINRYDQRSIKGMQLLWRKGKPSRYILFRWWWCLCDFVWEYVHGDGEVAKKDVGVIPYTPYSKLHEEVLFLRKLSNFLNQILSYWNQHYWTSEGGLPACKWLPEARPQELVAGSKISGPQKQWAGL